MNRRLVSVRGHATVTSKAGRVRVVREAFAVYVDTRDWWVGYYRGDGAHYVCLLPCVVIRWPR